MIKKNLIFVLLFTFLTGCSNLPTGSANGLAQRAVAQTSISDGTSIELDVALLQPLAEGESLLVAVLDVVSGSWIAPEFIPAVRIDGSHFQATLPIEKNGLVRYKYVKVGSAQVEEINSAGEEFQHRTIDPKLVGHISDVISGWQGGTAVRSTGRLLGTIKSSVGDVPLGGIQVEIQGRGTITDSFGRFEISGLPEGEYIVRFNSNDQKYNDYQQNAVIKADAVTLADVWLQESAWVDVTFSLALPSELGTNSDIHLIGDNPALGFGSDGVIAPSTAIKMEKTSNAIYQASVKLPVGVVIHYKYTLGDGFWGSEHTLDDALTTRTVEVAAGGTLVSDTIADFGGPTKRISIQVPQQTPADLPISIQFNAFEWSKPIPLTRDGKGGAVIEIAKPMDLVSQAQVRVCVGQYQLDCGIFDGANTTSISFDTTEPVDLVIDDWEQAFLEFPSSDFSVGAPQSNSPEAGYSFAKFDTGAEFLAAVQASQLPTVNNSVMIVELSARMTDDGLRFATDYNGLSVGDPNLVNGLTDLRSKGLDPWLYLNVQTALSSVDPSFSGSDPVQFDRFAEQLAEQLINLVQVANLSGVETIVIGGAGFEAMTPGVYPVEQASSAWQTAIDNMRSHFNGRIYYSANYNNYGLSGLPGFELDVDGFLIDWSTGTAVSEDQGIDELAANIQLMLEYDIIPAVPLGKRIILRANVPSNVGVLWGCTNNDQTNCVVVDGGAESADTIAQTLVYRAFMTALAEREDIEGFVSGGFNTLSVSVDSTSNVFGKPAFTDIQNWIDTVYAQ